MCVITAYGVQCLVAGCRESGVGQKAMRPGRGICTTGVSHVAQHSRATWLTKFEVVTWLNIKS